MSPWIQEAPRRFQRALSSCGGIFGWRSWRRALTWVGDWPMDGWRHLLSNRFLFDHRSRGGDDGASVTIGGELAGEA